MPDGVAQRPSVTASGDRHPHAVVHQEVADDPVGGHRRSTPGTCSQSVVEPRQRGGRLAQRPTLRVDDGARRRRPHPPLPSKCSLQSRNTSSANAPRSRPDCSYTAIAPAIHAAALFVGGGRLAPGDDDVEQSLDVVGGDLGGGVAPARRRQDPVEAGDDQARVGRLVVLLDRLQQPFHEGLGGRLHTGTVEAVDHDPPRPAVVGLDRVTEGIQQQPRPGVRIGHVAHCASTSTSTLSCVASAWIRSTSVNSSVPQSSTSTATIGALPTSHSSCTSCNENVLPVRGSPVMLSVRKPSSRKRWRLERRFSRSKIGCERPGPTNRASTRILERVPVVGGRFGGHHRHIDLQEALEVGGPRSGSARPCT